MGARYEIWLTSDTGVRLIPLKKHTVQFEYTRVVNDVGAFTLVLDEGFDRDLIHLDYRVEFWRAPEDGQLLLDQIGFIRAWQFATNSRGITEVTLSGPDLQDVLARRIVAYAAYSAYSDKSGAADDLMKDFVRESLGDETAAWDGTANGASRDVTGKGFQVQVDVTGGPTIAKAAAWRNLLLVLQDIADGSRQAGTELYFDVVPLARGTYEFQTFTAQRGRDRTWSGGVNPLLFGLDYGNMREPRLLFDYRGEVNYVYAAGQGEGVTRTIAERSDTARIGQSAWNRREALADARHCDITGANYTSCVQSAGDTVLAAGRPRRKFEATLVDTSQSRYQRDWTLGDRVTVTYLDRMYDVMLRGVRVQVDRDGWENIEAFVEAED